MANRRDLPKTVEVARILRPHGVRGEVSVELYSDHPERLAVGSELRMASGGGAGNVIVTSSRRHKCAFLVRFKGYDSRDDVERLRGVVLEVPRDRVPEAVDDDTYYYFELVGCRCEDRQAGFLGVVADVIEDGGGLLLEVDRGEEKLLIPFVRAFLGSVDVDGGSIELQLPPGLLETCVSES